MAMKILDANASSVGGAYTVATLPAPTAAIAGAHTVVTDALTPALLGTLTGGGNVVCPVFCNGTAWVLAPGAPLGAFTVATLPTASAALKGALAYVTDATSPTYLGALTGTGTVVCPVFCDGTAWLSA